MKLQVEYSFLGYTNAYVQANEHLVFVTNIYQKNISFETESLN